MRTLKSRSFIKALFNNKRLGSAIAESLIVGAISLTGVTASAVVANNAFKMVQINTQSTYAAADMKYGQEVLSQTCQPFLLGVTENTKPTEIVGNISGHSVTLYTTQANSNAGIYVKEIEFKGGNAQGGDIFQGVLSLKYEISGGQLNPLNTKYTHIPIQYRKNADNQVTDCAVLTDDDRSTACMRAEFPANCEPEIIMTQIIGMTFCIGLHLISYEICMINRGNTPPVAAPNPIPGLPPIATILPQPKTPKLALGPTGPEVLIVNPYTPIDAVDVVPPVTPAPITEIEGPKFYPFVPAPRGG